MYVFGWIGTILTLVYKLPQVVKLYRLKTAKGISIYSYNIQTVGSGLYIIHGYIIEDDPIMVMGAVTLLLNIIICIQLYYYAEIDRLRGRNYNSTSICSSDGP